MNYGVGLDEKVVLCSVVVYFCQLLFANRSLRLSYFQLDVTHFYDVRKNGQSIIVRGCIRSVIKDKKWGENVCNNICKFRFLAVVTVK